MKCNDCVNLLEEYIDGEAAVGDAELVRAHLITCTACTKEFESMTAEQEIYSRYDREVEISPAMWNAIAARTIETRPIDSSSQFSLQAWLTGLFAAPRYGFAGAMAVLVLGVVLGVMYFRTSPQPVTSGTSGVASNQGSGSAPRSADQPRTPIATSPINSEGTSEVGTGPGYRAASFSPGKRENRKSGATNQSDVLFPDIAYSKIEEKDTADHIAQAQNLMRSIRNLQLSDTDEAVDVTYEKAMSRRLLSENQVLRADAEASGKFPVKALLGDLEPFLIDIANLPDKTTPGALRVIKDRVQQTEIVAALQVY